MHGRLTIVDGPADRAKEVRELITGTVMPGAREIPGLVAGYWLANDEGRVVGLALFESEEAIVASREAVRRIREGAASQLGATVVSVEEFEVIGQI